MHVVFKLKVFGPLNLVCPARKIWSIFNVVANEKLPEVEKLTGLG